MNIVVDHLQLVAGDIERLCLAHAGRKVVDDGMFDNNDIATDGAVLAIEEIGDGLVACLIVEVVVPAVVGAAEEDGELYARQLAELFTQMEARSPRYAELVVESAVETVLLHLRNGDTCQLLHHLPH